MRKVKIKIKEITGYRHFNKEGIQKDKPKDGFVQTGNLAFPKNKVSNWEQLPKEIKTA